MFANSDGTLKQKFVTMALEGCVRAVPVFERPGAISAI